MALLAAGAPEVQKGVALGLFASDAAWDYGPLLDEIKALGATHVELDVVWTQPGAKSARIHRRPGVSPDDATVLRTIRQARARGLAVMVFPIVRLEEHTKKEWRGTIAPAAGVDAWFASYRDFLVVMADLAEAGGAARLSVGSELLSLEGHEADWRKLIAEVRTRFHGALLYSANWDHFEQVPFWDAVDEAGVTAYFELDEKDLARSWAGPRASLVALKERLHKPLVVTEVGYPSLEGAARRPWDETATAPVDVAGQERLLSAACDALSGAVDGAYVWNWFGTGAQDGSYSPRGKPAAAAVARCLRSEFGGSPASRGTVGAGR